VTGTDLLLANVEEVDVLGGEAAPAVHAAAGVVVVKHGAAGARWLGSGGAAVRADAVPVAVVDPTGAGDAFAAGLLSAWLAGADPAAALAAGARLGAEAVQVIGARP
jgi:sugar/nucleoside kinase (ribokinase family)